MKDKTFVLNILLTLLWGLLMAGFVLCRSFFPAAVLPAMDIPLLLGVCLAALLLEHWAAPGGRRAWLSSALLAGVSFGLLPLCAGVVGVVEALKLTVAGGATFVASTVLFDSALCRLSSATGLKAAPVIVGVGLFLAGQSLANIFF